MRIFLDANILFSAAQPQSRMSTFLELMFERGECLTNAYAAEEARRNLALKSPGTLKALERLVKRCEMVSRLAADLEADLPLKDQPILGGAIAGRATHLLTGDERDFGKFWGKTVQGVKIVSPRMLAEELLK
ncbi:MAG: PIN domain-containing protein [Limisphaerales bacterium]